MGRATILEHLADARYRIRLEYDTALLERRIQRMVERRQQLQAAATSAQVEENSAYSELLSARLALNAAIADYAADLVEQKVVTERTATAISAGAVWQAARAKRRALDAQLLSVSMDIDQAEAIRTQPATEIEAWCADYSDELAGEVGTIEVTGEPAGEGPGGHPPIIHPGWEGAAVWACPRDGTYQRHGANNPFAGLTNAMQLAAWQMHRPRHRVGQIVELDPAADTCSLVIDSETSSVQGLAIDPADPVLLTQADVPIAYMDCNSAVFAVGDRVVVALEGGDWTRPLVIGFESQPVPCGSPGWYVLPASDDCPAGWGQPIDDETGDIIPGTCGGPDPWQHIGDSAEQTVRRGLEAPVYSNITWFGPETGAVGSRRRDVLSWQGPRSRYWPRYQTGAFNHEDKCDPSDGVAACPSSTYRAGTVDERTTNLQVCRPYGVAIYRNGRHLVDAPLPVLGAAIQQPAEGERWLIAVCYDDQQADVVMRYPLFGESPTWQTLLTRARPDADWFPPDAIWTFSEDGTEASTMRPRLYPLDIENGETDGEGNPVSDSIYRHILRLDVSGAGATITDEGRQYEVGRAVYAVDYIANDRAELLAHPLEDDTWLELRTPSGTVPVLTAADALGVGQGDGFFVGSLSIDDGLKVDGVGTTAPLFRSASLVYHLDLRDPAGVIALVASEAGGSGRIWQVKSRVGGAWETSYSGDTSVNSHSTDWGGVLEAWSALAGDPGEKVGQFMANDFGDEIGEDVRSPSPPKAFAAGVAPEGRAFLALWWGYLATTSETGDPYGYHFTEGDPVALLEIPGDSPRFHPLTYVGG